MKTAAGNDDLRHEWYVVEIDGKPKSRYGVYVGTWRKQAWN
jgi:hypothetical protein